jgi:hypothetical protein
MLSCLICNARPPLCDVCCSTVYDQLKGVAECRGTVWADAVLALTALRPQVRGRMWPAWSDEDERGEAARALAKERVADIAGGDEALGDLLARKCFEAAARRWAMETAEATQPVATHLSGPLRQLA